MKIDHMFIDAVSAYQNICTKADNEGVLRDRCSRGVLVLVNKGVCSPSLS